MLKPLLAFLKSRNDVRIIGPDDAELRAATVSIIPLSKSVAEVARSLCSDKLMVGRGDFYSVRPLREMSIDLDSGVLRLSFVHYTSRAEIDKLIRGLDNALGVLGAAT